MPGVNLNWQLSHSRPNPCHLRMDFLREKKKEVSANEPWLHTASSSSAAEHVTKELWWCKFTTENLGPLPSCHSGTHTKYMDKAHLEHSVPRTASMNEVCSFSIIYSFSTNLLKTPMWDSYDRFNDINQLSQTWYLSCRAYIFTSETHFKNIYIYLVIWVCVWHMCECMCAVVHASMEYQKAVLGFFLNHFTLFFMEPGAHQLSRLVDQQAPGMFLFLPLQG